MTETEKDNKTEKSINADGVVLTYYTDPLCCWSWAMMPQLRQLKEITGNSINIRYCMAGMLPDWNSYHDTVNAISRPVQMGPLWMEVRHRTGVALHDRIWMTDPPASSYPACIAVKCAGLQGSEYEEQMFGVLQEAVMVEGKNIARNIVLAEAADKMPLPFDRNQFREDILKGRGIEAFRKDMEEIRLSAIERFPSVTISANGKAILITGYRNAEVLTQGIQKLLA